MIGIVSGMRAAILCICASCIGAADEIKTLHQLQQEAAQTRGSQTQSDGTGAVLKLTVAAPSAGPCPDPVAVGLLKHYAAYQRTEESDPLRGLSVIHAKVWMRGPISGFYIEERLNGFATGVRMTYLFGQNGLQGGGTCPVERNWRECVAESAGVLYANDVVRACTTTIDMHAISPWQPSPNDGPKRVAADDLRREIEAKWPEAREIVIRDFNLQDPQITIYLKMPDGDYYEGCGFHASGEPHCEGWHLFGTVPNSKIRERIFEKPYRLK